MFIPTTSWQAGKKLGQQQSVASIFRWFLLEYYAFSALIRKSIGPVKIEL